jgi:hypothetical protein
VFSVNPLSGKLFSPTIRLNQCHPNLLLSDLSSVVSNYCSQWKNFNRYISTEWANHYEIIQLVKEAVVTGTGGGENFNPGKWHYETIIWGGLWEKTVVVWDELPSGGEWYCPLHECMACK